MREAWDRIWAMVLRYSALHRRSILRTFDVFFWPVMDLLVWGFVTVYFQRHSPGAFELGASFLIGGMILWDLHYRAQQGVTISLMEEIWTRNIVNLFVTPLRRWEWFVATILYGLGKVAVVGLVLGILAFGLYAFQVWTLGWVLVPLVAELMLFAWALGLVTAGFVVRFGYAAEVLIWGIPFLIQPFSAVFYPVEVLPVPFRAIALALPTTYIFEDLRAALAGNLTLGVRHVLALSALNGVYLLIGAAIFGWLFQRAQTLGRLGHLGQD